jgi:K+-transporting ATPase ATPase C chain
MKDIVSLVRFSLAGLRVLLLLTVVVGIGYPLAVTGVAQVALPWQANGSLVTDSGQHTQDPDGAVGAALFGQAVADDGLFLPRPSAAGDGYDTLGTYGSNYGPEAPELVESIRTLKAEVAEREGVSEDDVPPDAVTASASGLDPHISEAYAELQVARVAEAQGLAEQDVRDLVAEHTDGRTAGVLGEPGVNVLLLNIAVLAAAGD